MAEVDQALIDNVYKMTSPAFVKDGDRVSRPVQTLNMLAHELSLYPDEKTATAAAKSIISMAAKGEGVKGGLRKATHPRRFLNKTEKELVRDALTKAADYLQRQNQLDLFLESSIGGMLTAWDDGAIKKHGSIVLSLLMAAREKAARTDILAAKARAIVLVPDTANLVLDQLSDVNNWRSATTYMTAPNPNHRYNAIAWKALEAKRLHESSLDTEYQTRILGKFPLTALTPTSLSIDFLNEIAEELERTHIPEKALLLSTQIMECMKHVGSDLRNIVSPTTTNQTNFRKAVIRALAAVEKFRRYESGQETTNPNLQTEAPKVVDYQNASANPESQAVLLTLVTLVQELIDYPLSSVGDLRDFFVIQRNDSLISATIQEKLALLNPGVIITELLVEDIKRAHKTLMPITERQKILIDQQALEHLLIYENIPEFDFTTGTMTSNWRFLRFIRSLGDGECGYYSLRNINNSKEEYKRKIIDNLKRPEIRTLLERLVYHGRGLYAELSKPEATITPGQSKVMAKIAAIKDEKENKMKLLRHNGSVPEGKQLEAQKLDVEYEIKEEPLYTELAATAPFSDVDLATHVSQEIDTIDDEGWLDLGSTDNWHDQKLTFPYVYALLNHYDVYVWVEKAHKGYKKELYENAGHFLANFVSGRTEKTYAAEKIILYNSSGKIHYDKWVEDDNYPDLTDALRHKKLHKLGTTR